MYKTIFSFLFMLLLVTGSTAVMAQDSPKKLVKEAQRSLNNYNFDNTKKNELEEARNYITQALEHEDAHEIRRDADPWLVKGEIFNTMAKMDLVMYMQDPTFESAYPQAALEAYHAYNTALELAEKKHEISDALKGVGEASASLSSVANQYISKREYKKAYPYLDAVIVIDRIYIDHEEPSLFPTPEEKLNHLYVTAVTAEAAGEMEKAVEMYEFLIENEYSEPAVYSNYFNYLIKEGEDERAMKVLEIAKGQFGETEELLYAEINYYIKTQQLDLLQEKLELAIEKNPDNPSLYVALGNVYTQLTQQTMESDNKEAAERYKKQALDYLHKATELAPNSFESYYNIGQLYYNEAAAYTQEMSELGLSAEEQKKYAKLEAKTQELFKKAFEPFKEAEKLNPNDINTLVALKEIAARLNKIEMSKELGERLDAVRAGQTFEDPYCD